LNLSFLIAHRSDVGLVRKHNEDRVAVLSSSETPFGGPLAVVADGLGGHAAGEVASQIAVDEVTRTIRTGTAPLTELLRQGIEAAHAAILEKSKEDETLHGMGTTCTVLAVEEGRVHLAHVGDSRAYRLHEGALVQVSRDHTVVQELLDESVIEPAEAELHPAAHVLTRALGMDEPLDVDVTTLDTEVSAGDRFLLCSDGLSGQVTDRELAHALKSSDLEAACDHLIRMACNSGGPDNITVAIIAVLPGD